MNTNVFQQRWRSQKGFEEVDNFWFPQDGLWGSRAWM